MIKCIRLVADSLSSREYTSTTSGLWPRCPCRWVWTDGYWVMMTWGERLRWYLQTEERPFVLSAAGLNEEGPATHIENIECTVTDYDESHNLPSASAANQWQRLLAQPWVRLHLVAALSPKLLISAPGMLPNMLTTRRLIMELYCVKWHITCPLVDSWRAK
jgi:hypothetical protein